jgi:hypothetical protein
MILLVDGYSAILLFVFNSIAITVLEYFRNQKNKFVDLLWYREAYRSSFWRGRRTTWNDGYMVHQWVTRGTKGSIDNAQRPGRGSMMRPTINEESDCLRKKNLHRRVVKMASTSPTSMTDFFRQFINPVTPWRSKVTSSSFSIADIRGKKFSYIQPRGPKISQTLSCTF